MRYKYCIVPKCKNTTIKTPDKLFFQVPRDERVRKNWCVVMKRTKPLVSATAVRHCCEDHFDVETDMENYVRYKLIGGFLKLKKGVMPHKFDCQQPPKKVIERNAIKKREHLEFLRRVLSPNIEHENLLTQPVEFQDCGTLDEKFNSDPLTIPDNENEQSNPKTKVVIKKHKAVQVNITNKTKTIATNTPKRRNRNKEIENSESITYDIPRTSFRCCCKRNACRKSQRS